MSKWSFVALGDVCDVIAGGTPSRKNPKYFGGDIAWVKISDMLQGCITSTDETITKAGLENSAAKILPAGTILISIFATVGRTAVLGIDAATNQAIVGVIPKPEVKLNKFFLRYALDNSILELAKEARGVAQVNINGKILKSLKIPLPSLPEQERIVRLLDEAESLRVARLHATERMEDFVPALFDEMFGDPAKNPKKWETVKLGEKITFMTSGSRGWARYYSESGDLFLRIQNVGENQLLLEDVAYVNAPDTVESNRTRVQAGDLLISATADIGRTGVIPNGFPTAYINQHLFLLRLSDFDPCFVAGYFSTPNGKSQILQANRAAVKAGLNFNDVKNLGVFYPPLALQQEFASRVAEARGIQSAQERSAAKVEALYQSMLSRAFAGEL